MKFGIKDNTFELIVNALKNCNEIDSAVIFGSRAKGNYKKGSDIDIALKGENLSDEIITRLSRIINIDLPVPYKVDLINYNHIKNKDLIEHIERVGIPLFQ
jgi:predicted nucleotidyltransferase